KKLRVVARDDLAALYTSLPWVDEFVLAKTAKEELAAMGQDCECVVGLHPSSELHGFLACLRRPRQRIGFRNRRLTDLIWTNSIGFDPTVYRGLHFLQLLDAVQPLDPVEAGRACIAALAAAAPTDDGEGSSGR